MPGKFALKPFVLPALIKILVRVSHLIKNLHKRIDVVKNMNKLKHLASVLIDLFNLIRDLEMTDCYDVGAK